VAGEEAADLPRWSRDIGDRGGDIGTAVNGAIGALEQTSASLGAPSLARTVGEAWAPIAAIARWRHAGATVDIAASDAVRLTLSLVDGQKARARSGTGHLADRVRSGSISVFSATEPGRDVTGGQADVLQIFLARGFVETATGERLVQRPIYDVHDDLLHASFMQASSARV
jgi:hypothetical protein